LGKLKHYRKAPEIVITENFHLLKTTDDADSRTNIVPHTYS